MTCPGILVGEGNASNGFTFCSGGGKASKGFVSGAVSTSVSVALANASTGLPLRKLTIPPIAPPTVNPATADSIMRDRYSSSS